MVGLALVIWIPCQSRNVVMLEHTNIIKFFIVYSQSQSILIFHVEDVLVQDTISVIPNTDWIHFHERIIFNCCKTGALRKWKLSQHVSNWCHTLSLCLSLMGKKSCPLHLARFFVKISYETSNLHDLNGSCQPIFFVYLVWIIIIVVTTGQVIMIIF